MDKCRISVPFLIRLVNFLHMAKKPVSSGITKQQWIDLADQAFYRLKEMIELAPTEDPKLLKAIEDSFDRAYGKPTEKHEVGGKNGGPIVIKWQE